MVVQGYNRYGKKILEKLDDGFAEDRAYKVAHERYEPLTVLSGQPFGIVSYIIGKTSLLEIKELLGLFGIIPVQIIRLFGEFTRWGHR